MKVEALDHWEKREISPYFIEFLLGKLIVLIECEVGLSLASRLGGT